MVQCHMSKDSVSFQEHADHEISFYLRKIIVGKSLRRIVVQFVSNIMFFSVAYIKQDCHLDHCFFSRHKTPQTNPMGLESYDYCCWSPN